MDNIDLPRLYHEKLKSLIESLKNVTDVGKARKLFNDFTKSYTTIPSIWIQWEKYEIDISYGTVIVNHNIQNFLLKLRRTALSHFYDDNFVTEFNFDTWPLKVFSPKGDRMFCKVITYPYVSDHFVLNDSKKDYINNLELALSFPHQHLEIVFHLYEEHSESFTTTIIKKLFEKNLNLYRSLNIYFKTNNAKKWFELLYETRDNDLIIQNMEYYIANKPCQKNAWKIYINFLGNINVKAMFGVYSRYCRFFLEDYAMRKEYQQKVMNLQNQGYNLIKWIIDLIVLGCIEFNVGQYNRKFKNLYKMSEHTLDILQKSLIPLENYQTKMKRVNKISKCHYDVWFMKENIKVLVTFDIEIFSNNDIYISLLNLFNDNIKKEDESECKIKWNSVNMKQYQSFSFCADIIRYISKNYPCRQKLYQTCKYFFAKFQLPICYSLSHVSTMNKKLFVVNSFWLPTECFEEFGSRASKVNHDMDDMIVTTKLFTSLFSEVYINMNKLKFDTIKYLSFFNCGNLTLHDISVITKHCNLISVRLIYVKIYRNSSVDAPPATIEDVVTGFGDVKIFHLKNMNTIYTPDTMKKLLEISKPLQFKHFYLTNATNDLNINDFFDFLTICAAPNCHFGVVFHLAFKQHEREFSKIAKNFLSSWEPKPDVPYNVTNMYGSFIGL